MFRPPTIVAIAALAILVAACSPSQAETGSSAPPETSSPDTAASDTTATTVPLDAVPSNYVGFLHQDTACGGDQPDPAVDMKFDAPGVAAVEDALEVTLNTSCGPIEIALEPGVAPETVNSFVFLAEEGYFDGTVSHRIIPGFMMQAGDPTARGRA